MAVHGHARGKDQCAIPKLLNEDTLPVEVCIMDSDLFEVAWMPIICDQSILHHKIQLFLIIYNQDVMMLALRPSKNCNW